MSRLTLAASAIALLWICAPAPGETTSFVVTPREVHLSGNFARAQLVVTQGTTDRKVGDSLRESPASRVNVNPGAGDSLRESPTFPLAADFTSQARFTSADPSIVTVTAAGQIVAQTNGETLVSVTVENQTRDVPVRVTGLVDRPTISFGQAIRPILTKSGCAMAACHAAQHGQGGFKLSVFGFEPEKDRLAMVRDSQQRRADFVDPERSLLLLKPTMQVPHGGGKRLEKGSVDYQVLLAWLNCGAPGPAKDEPEVVRLHVFPTERVAHPHPSPLPEGEGAEGITQQLRVEAEYSDNSRRDVTAWAKYDSLDDGVLSVTKEGLVKTVGKGQAAVMIRFEGSAATSLFVVPFGDKVELADWRDNNFIDNLAAARFRELGIEPSPLCDDATFIRRAFLDAIGTLPTPEQTRAFLDSPDDHKRARLIDSLLGLTGDAALDIHSDAYAAWWSLRWSDLLRNNSADLGEQGMWAMHNWIRESLRANKPFDRFVRELVTARGSIYTSGPANYYRIHKDAPMLAEATAQLFLGVRLECAKCHHHPFEKYSQDDYYGMAAFFARTGTKNSEEFGLFGREQAVIVRDTGDVRHPRTNQVVSPKPLDGEPLDHPLDRRMPLADWLTSKDNGYFARSVVNRYMSYLLGRGLVDPVDDLRSTNPPTNPPLMDALARHFTDSGFDLKQLVRVIMQSRLYQLSSQPTPANAADDKFYSHFAVKRLAAEPLIDAIDQVTAMRTKYRNLPLGTRAIELPDAEYPDYFLNTFAKPRRVSVCECERAPDPSLAQALHTLNGDVLALKLRDKEGRVLRLVSAKTPHDEIVNELYLAALSRFPSEGERAASHELLAESPSPAEFYQDLLWALMNSKQFLFVH